MSETILGYWSLQRQHHAEFHRVRDQRLQDLGHGSRGSEPAEIQASINAGGAGSDGWLDALWMDAGCWVTVGCCALQ